MRLRAPDDAPQWLHVFARRIAEANGERADQPVKLAKYATTSDLPDATRWEGGIIYVTSLATAVISDGTNWFPVTVGAAL